MAILAGQTALADDFINESEKSITPSNDNGKVAKLEVDGKYSDVFIHGANIVNLTAGENLTTRDAVFVSKDVYNQHSFNTNTGSYAINIEDATGSRWSASIYTMPDVADGIFINEIVIDEGKYTGGGGSAGTNYGAYTAFIYAVDGSNNPTGSALQTSDDLVINTWSTGQGEKTITFPTPVKLDANTKYAITLRYTTSDEDARQVRGGGTPDGFVTSKSSTDGTTWSAGSVALYLKADIKFGTTGKVYKTNAKYQASSEFLGFALKNSVTDTEATIIRGSQLGGFTGLTSGIYYYLSNTSGQISNSAGDVSTKVAYANSTSSVICDLTGLNDII